MPHIIQIRKIRCRRSSSRRQRGNSPLISLLFLRTNANRFFAARRVKRNTSHDRKQQREANAQTGETNPSVRKTVSASHWELLPTGSQIKVFKYPPNSSAPCAVSAIYLSSKVIYRHLPVYAGKRQFQRARPPPRNRRLST